MLVVKTNRGQSWCNACDINCNDSKRPNFTKECRLAMDNFFYGGLHDKSACITQKYLLKTYFQSSVWNDDNQCFILVSMWLEAPWQHSCKVIAPYHYCIEVKVLENLALQLVVRYYMVTPL